MKLAALFAAVSDGAIDLTPYRVADDLGFQINRIATARAPVRLLRKAEHCRHEMYFPLG